MRDIAEKTHALKLYMVILILYSFTTEIMAVVVPLPAVILFQDSKKNAIIN
jgi:hypothetical protein